MSVKKNRLKLEAGLTAAALAAAATAYYFLGKNGAKNRKAAATWAHKAKNEAIAELKKIKNLDQKSYANAVNKVIAKYKKFQKDSPKEFAVLSAELKNAGAKILKHLAKPAKPVAKKFKTSHKKR